MMRDAGFTLVELLVALAISMILLAGLYSHFILQVRVQNEQAHRVTLVEDLQLAAHIMERELGFAKAGSIRVATNVGVKLCYANPNGETGCFWYNHPKTASGLLGPGSICWDRPPGDGKCNANEELLRGLKSNGGLAVVQDGNVWTITFTGIYVDNNKQEKELRMSFSVSPRN